METETSVSLTNRETEILKLTAIGMAADETADKLSISPETVRKIISNIKQKLNLQKATELTAAYWCQVFGTSLEEQRKQILAALMLFIIVTTIPFEHFEATRLRRSYRQICRAETRIIYRKEA